MVYILILIVHLGGPSSSTAIAEFNNELSCRAAVDWLLKHAADAACFSKGKIVEFPDRRSE